MTEEKKPETTPAKEVKNAPEVEVPKVETTPTPDLGAKTTATKPKEDIPEWALDLKKDMITLQEENQMLKDLAGKNAMKSLLEGQEDHTVKKAHFKVYKGKTVIGWEKLDDSEFVFDKSNRTPEKLVMTLKFRDGEEPEKADYLQFDRINDKVYAEILTLDPIGNTKVRFEDGKEFTIPTKFLNA